MSSVSGPLTCVLLLISVGMYSAPNGFTSSVRRVVADALRPGQAIARQASQWLQTNLESLAVQSAHLRHQESDQLQDELRLERSRTAALQIQLARMADHQARDLATPEPLRTLPRLTSSSLIEATVLGDALSESWRAGKLLDQGEANGVRESSLVLQSSQPLVDLGRDADVSAEDELLLGRCVIGKIERVGRWTSTFVLLTDSEYRGRAQLVHQTDSGFVFGARGILKGQGQPCCRLEGISSAESVVVGDAVYTTNRDGLQTTPLYYGRVTEAILGPNDKEWRVLVAPVPIPHNLSSVQILRTAVNSQRLAAGSPFP